MVEQIDTLKELDDLIADEGTIIYCAEDGNYYHYFEKAWHLEEFKAPEGGLQLNVYELNKQIYAQLPTFDKWEEAKDIFEKWCNDFSNNEFFLLYGRDLGYFTLFKKDNKEEDKTFFDAIREVLEPFNVKDFSKIEEEFGPIEIWVEYNDEISCMYLFPYDEGVVTYRG